MRAKGPSQMPKKKTAKKRTNKKVKEAAQKDVTAAAPIPNGVADSESQKMTPDEINQAHLLATLKELTSLAESGAIKGLVFVADGQAQKRGWSGNVNVRNVMMPLELTKLEISMIALNQTRGQQAVG